MLEMTPRLQKKLGARGRAAIRAAEKDLRLTQSILIKQIEGVEEAIELSDIDHLCTWSDRLYFRSIETVPSENEKILQQCVDMLKRSFLAYTTLRDRVQANLDDAENNAISSSGTAGDLFGLAGLFLIMNKFMNLAEK